MIDVSDKMLAVLDVIDEDEGVQFIGFIESLNKHTISIVVAETGKHMCFDFADEDQEDGQVLSVSILPEEDDIRTYTIMLRNQHITTELSKLATDIASAVGDISDTTNTSKNDVVAELHEILIRKLA